jgi:error-prone DNA polymerase
MTQKGVEREAQEQIIHQIQSFALYGFPESHSASFALIAYASAYLKCHHPAAFLTGLLNAWPMGFYHPASLIQDALRHGVTIHPIDVTRSFWRCTLEPEGLRPAIRLGLRYAGKLRENTAATIVKERRLRPFTSLADFSTRAEPHRDELDTLAELGSLGNLPGGPQKRREALWQVAALERDAHSLFAGAEPPDPASPLEEMTEPETTLADYRLAGITTGPHFLAHLRPSLRKRGFLSAKQIQNVPNGHAVRMAAHVIVRQRPASARGFCFLTLEDETGTANAVLTPDTFNRFRDTLHDAALVEVSGPLQKVEGVLHIRVKKLAPLLRETPTTLPASHDYR